MQIQCPYDLLGRMLISKVCFYTAYIRMHIVQCSWYKYVYIHRRMNIYVRLRIRSKQCKYDGHNISFSLLARGAGIPTCT